MTLDAENRVGYNMPEHGTESTYTNWKCRCGPCRDAHAAGAKRRRAARKRKLKRGAGK